MMFSFFEAATKFADKLDQIARATFGVFSSTQHSNETRNEPWNNGQKEPTALKYEITPPPRAYISNYVKPKLHSRRQVSERIDTKELPVQFEEGTPEESSELEFLVIKRGHVKKLVKMYEEFSNLSSERFFRGPEKHESLTEPSQQDTFPITPLRGVELKSPVRIERLLNKAVTKPPSVASVSSIIGHHSMPWGAPESNRHIKLFDEAEATLAGDSSNYSENGDGNHDSVLEMQSGRRYLWSMFCIPTW